MIKFGRWIKALIAATLLVSAPTLAADSGVMESNFVVVRKPPVNTVSAATPAPAAPAVPVKPALAAPVVSAPAAPVVPAPVAAAPPPPPAPPAGPPLNLAPPAPKEVHTRECAKNLEEFKKSPMLIKVLGEKYDPFSHWTSSSPVEIVPAKEKGMMTVKIQGMARAFENDHPLPMEICVDADKPKVAYMVRYKVRYEFDDPKGNSFTLGSGMRSATFNRAETGK